MMILDCDEIIPNRLWVGGYIRPEDVARLAAMGITAIISLQSDHDLAACGLAPEPIDAACAEARIRIHRIPVIDGDCRILVARLPEAVGRLEMALAPADARVYAHCTAGMNRAPTLAAAYLIKCARLSAREAYDYVLAHRSCNPYLDVLREYEALIFDSASRPTASGPPAASNPRSR